MQTTRCEPVRDYLQSWSYPPERGLTRKVVNSITWSEPHTVERSLAALPAAMCNKWADCLSELQRLGAANRTVGLIIHHPELHLPQVYGHIWSTMYALYNLLLKPRLSISGNLEWLSVALPSGPHLGARGEHAFEEAATLFSCPAARLRVVRAPWVPLCWRGCCWFDGLATSQDSQSSALLLVQALGRGGWLSDSQFRDGVRSCMSRGDASAAQTGKADAWALHSRKWTQAGYSRAASLDAVWVLSGSGSNGRKVHNESLLVERVREKLQHDTRRWRFRTLDPASTDYADEMRVLAHASLVFSLFGSSLHNCRVMARGTVVVEIHGALKNDFANFDDYLYDRLCSELLGMHWVGFAARSPRPQIFNWTLAAIPDRQARSYFRHAVIDGESTYGVAHIDVVRFMRFLGLLLNGQLASARSMYEADLACAPDPRDIAAEMRRELARGRAAEDVIQQTRQRLRSAGVPWA